MFPAEHRVGELLGILLSVLLDILSSTVCSETLGVTTGLQDAPVSVSGSPLLWSACHAGARMNVLRVLWKHQHHPHMLRK